MADQADDDGDVSSDAESEWRATSEMEPDLIEDLSNEEFFEEEPDCEDIPGIKPAPNALDDEDMPGLQQVSDSSDDEDPRGSQTTPNPLNDEDLVEEEEPEDDDLPGLDPLSDSDDEGEGPRDPLEEALEKLLRTSESSSNVGEDDALLGHIQAVLTRCQPFPGDDKPTNLTRHPGESRFIVER
jgi:hypothetical protein